MYETIIWATDGSDDADLALDEALRIAELTGGRIVAVHCDQRLTGRAMGWPVLADEDEVRLRIRRRVAELKDAGRDIELVVRRSQRDAVHVIAAIAAELGGDLIVCGTRGLGAISGALLGNFTRRLLHVAPCPVLAVPAHAAVATSPPRVRTEVHA